MSERGQYLLPEQPPCPEGVQLTISKPCTLFGKSTASKTSREPITRSELDRTGVSIGAKLAAVTYPGDPTKWCPKDYHMALGGAVQAGLREHYVQQVAQVPDLLKTAAEWQMVVYRDKGELCLMASDLKLVAQGKLESDQSVH
jgi:hypothetical protein